MELTHLKNRSKNLISATAHAAKHLTQAGRQFHHDLAYEWYVVRAELAKREAEQKRRDAVDKLRLVKEELRSLEELCALSYKGKVTLERSDHESASPKE